MPHQRQEGEDQAKPRKHAQVQDWRQERNQPKEDVEEAAIRERTCGMSLVANMRRLSFFVSYMVSSRFVVLQAENEFIARCFQTIPPPDLEEQQDSRGGRR